MSDALPFASPVAERIHHLRWNLLGQLSQAAFADRFGIPYATVQNVEQARGHPKPLVQLLLAAIELDPALMERAAHLAAERAGRACTTAILEQSK